ncbi:MAG: hypothetical protein K5754_04610 [Butyrivibrio sp.]|nr:hypothetical protein [Butyrivibrio sp.]
MNRKKLIIEPGGGLGNRILALVSAFNLARDCNISNIEVLWRNNNECGCEFEDVLESLPLPCKVRGIHFGKESYKRLVTSGRLLSAIRKFVHQKIYNLFRWSVRSIQLPTAEGRNTPEYWGELKRRVIDNKANKFYIEAYYSFYGDVSCEGFKFNKDIESHITRFKEQNGNYIAMHIRRTDNEIAIKNSPTELFYENVARIVNDKPDTKIYIATDDLDILDDMKKKWPDNIIYTKVDSISRRSTEGIKFALYEMLILAGARTIYASYGSTFSQIANLIGGNEMIVVKK